jgi:N-acetylglucosaminyldiphosphoundecaprenol N-acetyl-beta-D-mannosaminyltransferase
MDNSSVATHTTVAGLHISTLTKQALVSQLEDRLIAREKTFIITPYSEFLYAVLHKPELLADLNKAHYAVADGIGVMWAATFLQKRFHLSSFYGKVFEGLCQIVTTGAKILLAPKSVRKIIPEKIVGADLFWDITAIAERLNKSVYILGGFGNTPQIVAEILRVTYPALRIAGISGKHPDDASIITDIAAAKPDILLVAFGPIRQDVWISRHMDKLPVSLAIGLGGTFDYVAGVKQSPPKFIRAIGLEWLYRLVTQPARLKRIRNATFGLVLGLLRYKVFMSQPLRKNVVAVVLNDHDQILVCKRKYEFNKDFKQTAGKFQNYWQFPQGGVDDGEQLEEAAVREIFEETGLKHTSLLKVSEQSHSYDWRNGARPLWFNRLKFRGQEQRIAYLKYCGENNDVRLDNREFEDYQWVSKDQLEVVLHPERKPLADIALEDLKGL